MTGAGVDLTATLRNGDIDQRYAFRHLGLTEVTGTVGLWKWKSVMLPLRADAVPEQEEAATIVSNDRLLLCAM